MNLSAAHFSASLASFKLQVLGSLANPSADAGFSSVFASLLALPSVESSRSPSDLLSGVIQLDAAKQEGLHAGRNMALPDPESAYRMMTVINNRDALYKAQFSELDQMQAAVAAMQEAGQRLADIPDDADEASIKTGLRGFADQYNGWIGRFAPGLQNGGLLAGTQAAEIAQYELEQSVKNVFNGIQGGFHGLADLGVSIDPGTRLIEVDEATLDAALARNRRGAVDTVREFGANFAQSARLLNAERNFIPNQLDNLDRAIRYIADNGAALRAEFGAGDAARPTGQVAQALAAYRQA